MPPTNHRWLIYKTTNSLHLDSSSGSLILTLCLLNNEKTSFIRFIGNQGTKFKLPQLNFILSHLYTLDHAVRESRGLPCFCRCCIFSLRCAGAWHTTGTQILIVQSEPKVMSHKVCASAAQQKPGWMTQVLLGRCPEPAWVVGCDKRWRHCWVQCLWKWWLRSPKLCSVSFPGIVFICQSEGVDQCESSHGPWSYLDAVHGQDLVLKSSSFLTAHPCFMKKVTQR